MFHKIALLLIEAVQIYSYILLIWVIGSWIPALRASKFYYYIDKIVYPYATIFRNFLPPLGGFDFSPIVAFIVLGLVQKFLAILLF